MKQVRGAALIGVLVLTVGLAVFLVCSACVVYIFPPWFGRPGSVLSPLTAAVGLLCDLSLVHGFT